MADVSSIIKCFVIKLLYVLRIVYFGVIVTKTFVYVDIKLHYDHPGEFHCMQPTFGIKLLHCLYLEVFVITSLLTCICMSRKELHGHNLFVHVRVLRTGIFPETWHYKVMYMYMHTYWCLFLSSISCTTGLYGCMWHCSNSDTTRGCILVRA